MNFLFRALALASITLPLWLSIMQTLIKTEDIITRNGNVSTRIARISLESKVLDLDEKFNDETLLLLNQPAHESARSTNSTSTSSSGLRKGKKAEKAGRRLSNIWSMFLPSSSNEDYEETISNGEESSLADNNNASSESKNTTVDVGEFKGKDTNSQPQDTHEEKLVAKYERPLKSDTQLPVESSVKSSARVQSKNQTASLNSAPLMASASSTSGSINSRQADINDIMSNIMNSMSSTGKPSLRVPATSLGRPMGAGDSVEREDDLLEGLPANKTTKEADQFERWLSKIRFRESGREGVNSNSTVGSSRKAHEPLVVRTEHSRSPARVSFSSDRKQDHGFGQTKTSSHNTKMAAARAPVHQFSRLRQSPGQQVVASKLVQSSQVSGFNQPYAQASTATIEINADDNSTAPANNKQAGIITGNLTEVSSEQSLLQSQDEILKQVTNAINFEQQQLNNRRENTLNTKSGSSQESSTPSSVVVQDEDSQLDSFKLFRVGTSLNELIDGSDRTPKPIAPNNTDSTSYKIPNSNTSESIQKNKSAGNETETPKPLGNVDEAQTSGLDKQLSSDQPMWLQHKLHLKNNHLLNGSLSKLASFMEGAGSSKFDKSQLNQLRELVEKHERTKNELKSSQESMYQFLKQFMGADASAKLLASQNAASLMNNHIGSVGGQKTAAQAHLGWTPMTLTNHEPMVHTDRFQGTARRPNAVKISQHKDNVGQGDDLLDKENYLDDLGGFYKEFQSDFISNHREPSDLMHASNLGAKGLVNDEEAVQLELAAHQLLGGHNKKPLLRSRLKVDPKAQLSQQKLATYLAESMVENAKRGGRFGSKQYTQEGKRQNGIPHNDLANLMQITEQDNQQQQEKLSQHPEESLNAQDPMSLQTSKLSSEASENLRHKDSAILVTRARLRPQMMAQLNLPAGPPAKIQLSLDSIANERPMASAKLRIPNLFSGSGVTGSFVTPDMAHDVGLRAPIVAANLPGNNLPVRFRELSIYRPFGYESHHAIAYQASPAVAALFPGFAQSTRPSILRHMTPFRAIQTQRGLINPIMPAFQVIDNPSVRSNTASQAADQIQQTASMQSASLPINGVSRIRPGFGAHFSNGSLLKRQSQRTKALTNKWASTLNVDPSMMQTRMKIRRSTGEDGWERRKESLYTVGGNYDKITSRYPHNRAAIRNTTH